MKKVSLCFFFLCAQLYPILYPMVAQDANTYAVDPVVLPLAGSVFCGIVAAYLVVSFLLSLYLALTALPEGDSSYLALNPRGLMVANGIVAFASTQGVGTHFARCGAGVAGGTVLFLLFCLLACWLDALPELLRSSGKIKGKANPVAEKVLKCLVVVVVGLAPVYMVFALIQGGDGVPGTVMVRCQRCIYYSL